MTSSNRLLNRVILLLVGATALGAAGLLVLPLLPASADGVRGAVEPIVAWLAVDSAGWWIAGAAAAIAALSIAWIASRGRGRTSEAVSTDGIVVDDTVVAGILRRGLASDPDVLGVSAHAFRRSGGVVLVHVETRSRANLTALLARVRSAVADADRTIGLAVPLVIHLTTGVRTAMAGSRITR